MSYLIKKWYLPKEEGMSIADYTFQPTADWLENLSKVNIFVGPNNFGKSRLMRYLIYLESEKYSPSYFDLDGLRSKIAGHLTTAREAHEKIADIRKIIPGLFDDSIIPLNYIDSFSPDPINIAHAIKLFSALGSPKIPVDTPNPNYVKLERAKYLIMDQLHSFRDELTNIEKDLPKPYKFQKIYIPTLRGLRPFQGDENVYFRRTLKDYFDNRERKNLVIFTGLEMYNAVRKHLLGDLSKRKLVENYEQFLANNFFEGKNLSLVPREEGGNDVVFVKIGKERELPIHKLGDGIQQLIIMTFPLFLYPDENILLFIEEPELYLHPGLQRVLLGFFTKEDFGNIQVFLTTHSNHFLDLCMDFDLISIFKFQKTLEEADSDEVGAKFIVANTSNEDSNTLEALGVRNSSVLLTNCTIWVEGITDRLYMRKYLEIYMQYRQENDGEKIYEEDKHFSFVEYSGNNITHWSFLDNDVVSIDVEKLCGTLFLIADRDDGKSERHRKLKKVLKKRYRRLQCREIENLLTPAVLLATIKGYSNVDVKKDIDLSQEDYKDHYIGEYIDNNILAKRSRKKFMAKSGTLKQKLDFAKKAINHINSIEDMSPEARKLAEKIYNFIKEHNQ